MCRACVIEIMPLQRYMYLFLTPKSRKFALICTSTMCQVLSAKLACFCILTLTVGVASSLSRTSSWLILATLRQVSNWWSVQIGSRVLRCWSFFGHTGRKHCGRIYLPHIPYVVMRIVLGVLAGWTFARAGHRTSRPRARTLLLFSGESLASLW